MADEKSVVYLSHIKKTFCHYYLAGNVKKADHNFKTTCIDK